MIKQYELEVDEGDETGVVRTSLVEKPATQKLFAIFSEEEKAKEVKQNFSIILPTPENEQKITRSENGEFSRIISGLWFCADTDIIRENPETGEIFTTRISKDQLNDALLKFVKAGNMNKVDVEHNGVEVEGIQCIEIWQMYDKWQLSPILLNSLYDLGYENWDDIPNGSVFASFYIDNEKFFNDEILSGNVKGFSIESIFNIIQLTEDKLKNMNKNEEMFSALGLVGQTEGKLKTKEGLFSIQKGEIKLGTTKLTKGTVHLDTGFSIVVNAGKIVDFGFDETVVAEVAPVVETETPVVETETPVVETETPVDETETPVVVETPVVETVDTEVTLTPLEIAKAKVAELEAAEKVETPVVDTTELDKIKAELATAKAELEKNKKATPIVKKTVGQTVPTDLQNYIVRKAGSLTFYIPKR